MKFFRDKKVLLKKLDCYLIGGSTVQDVKLDYFELIENEEEIYANCMPQNFSEDFLFKQPKG